MNHPHGRPEPLRLRSLLDYLRGRDAPASPAPAAVDMRASGFVGADGAELDALRQSLAAAEAAGRAKSQFLGRLGHEIRTPMNGITGMAELLSRTTLDATQRSYLELMQRSARQLVGLVDRLLDFARLEAGPVALRAEPVDLRALLDEATADAWPRALNKQLLLECRLAPDLPRWVSGDAARLRQIVNALLDNALEYTAVGQVVVTARPEAGGVSIEVADTGIGIPPELQARVFAPFVQGDASLARRQGGVGLGLAVVHLLVRAMEGRVELDSAPDRGARVRVHVPMRVLEPLSAPGAHRDGPAGAPRRVGLVSDAPATLAALVDRLQCLGHEVVAQTSWRDMAFAPEALRAAQPHTVLYDEPPQGWPPNAPQAVAAGPWRAIALQRRAESALDAPGVLPIVRPVADGDLQRALDALRRTAATGAAAQPEWPTGPRGRVLLVEDHEINQLVARSFLEHMGFEVDVADDAGGALSALGGRDYALLLMDCQMPGMDGYELTRRIRAGEVGSRAQRTPIVALTAHATPADRERCLDAGMNDYLAKPIDQQQLGRTIAHWLAPMRGPAG